MVDGGCGWVDGWWMGYDVGVIKCRYGSGGYGYGYVYG